MNTADANNPAIVYHCHSAAEAEELLHGLKRLFSDLRFELEDKSFHIYARQGPMQSIHAYLEERESAKAWLKRLAKEETSFKTKSVQLTRLILASMAAKLSQKNPLQEEIKTKQKLLHDLEGLDNEAGFWILCWQVIQFEKQIYQ